MTARKYIYELLHTSEIESRVEYVIRIVITCLILLSILSVTLESIDEIAESYSNLFFVFEVLTVLVFTVEYLLRVWSIVETEKYSSPILGRLRYMTSFMSLIDLLAVLPFYIPAILTVDLRFLRGFRLFRLFRILKLGQYSGSLRTIGIVLRKKKYDILTAFFIITLLLIISSSAMYFIEHDAQPMAFPNIPASLWWGVSTLTTIGYGDVVPITSFGRFFSSIISILGIGTFALPSGIIVSGLIDEMKVKTEPMKKLTYCPYCKEKLPH